MKGMSKFTALLILFSSTLATAEDWQLEVDSDGVQVWTRTRQDSKYKEARGEITVTASAQKVFSVIVSAETCREWVFSCVDSYVISRPNPQDGLVYMRTNSLWPVSDRDVVFLAATTYDHPQEFYQAQLSHKTDALPPVPGVVRISSMQGSWTVKGNGSGQSRVTFWSHVEPGGQLPSALVNFALSRLHKESLLKLREFLSKGD